MNLLLILSQKNFINFLWGQKRIAVTRQFLSLFNLSYISGLYETCSFSGIFYNIFNTFDQDITKKKLFQKLQSTKLIILPELVHLTLSTGIYQLAGGFLGIGITLKTFNMVSILPRDHECQQQWHI